MKNDSINEHYLHLNIVDQTESYFRVMISPPMNPEGNEGWIKKADYIGAYLKGEGDSMNLELFESTKAPESKKIIVSKWTPGLITIEKYADKSVFVSTMQNGQVFKGWIEMDKLCANSYTTCN